MYLAEVAVLTRLATGLTRVLENRPSKQKNPTLSEGQKKQAMAERFFVEILGTMGYMACLHLGQDLVDGLTRCKDRVLKFSDESLVKDLKSLDESQFSGIKKMLDKLNITVNDLDAKLKESVAETYGPQGSAFKSPVFKTLYEHELPGSTDKKTLLGKANLVTVKNQFKKKVEQVAEKSGVALEHQQLDAALSKIVNEVKPLKDFAKRNNQLAVLGIFTGVVGSALVGGSLTQWMNDRVIAPSAKKFFNRKQQKKGAIPLAASPLSPVPSAASDPAVTHKALSLVSAPSVMPLVPPVPVYLPNPKTQARPPIFKAQQPVLTPMSLTPKPWPGGGV
ncbi:hypothetical protein [Vampirovibrio chlorellavorus]|uniref:hypothetical protein n=1 Tax=Vampirovibrio chlorellavorus TaxID=758823 RepID=UPI0026F07E70|nr:hypothetical protein [Vampirovibrio chlorellavorus]